MNSNLPRQDAVVTDIHMPFGSMVISILKWAIATIIAMGILLALGALIKPSGVIHKSKVPAHEASAIASIRAIDEAEMIYASSHPHQGFTAELAMLGGMPQNGGEGTIDNNLSNGHESGYTFTYTPGEKVNGAIRSYTIAAVPDQVGSTGWRSFYSDETGNIHYNSSGPADATSPVLR